MIDRDAMANIDLKFVKAYRDRHKRLRHYFRRPGFKSVPLPGLPGSEEFMAAYQTAVGTDRTPIGASRTKPRSISALLVQFYQSAEFLTLRASTQLAYRNQLEKFRSKHGDKSAVTIQPHHLRAILQSMAATPAQASNLRKRLRQIFQLAADLNWRRDNPVLVVRPMRRKTEGHIPWSEDDIEAFERRWPVGSRERLALEILLCTGVRRSDLVNMGAQHVKGARIGVRMVKGQKLIHIPMHQRLRAAIAACPSGHLTYLVTQYGKPFSAPGFTKWFVEKAELAGLKDRTPHGLRKSVGRRLAEAGCTEKEIAGVLGHQSLSEVRIYTADAEQSRLADTAMRKLDGVK